MEAIPANVNADMLLSMRKDPTRVLALRADQFQGTCRSAGIWYHRRLYPSSGVGLLQREPHISAENSDFT